MQWVGGLGDALMQVQIASVGDQPHSAGLRLGPDGVGPGPHQDRVILPLEDEGAGLVRGEHDPLDPQVGVCRQNRPIAG